LPPSVYEKNNILLSEVIYLTECHKEECLKIELSNKHLNINKDLELMMKKNPADIDFTSKKDSTHMIYQVCIGKKELLYANPHQLFILTIIRYTMLK